MPINSHASLKRLITSRSSRDGSVFPLGWLCPTITAAAFDKIATFNTSLGWTRLAFRLPIWQTLTETGLILRVEADDEEVLPVEPIQELLHECVAVIRSVDGPSFIADTPFFDEFDADDVDTL